MLPKDVLLKIAQESHLQWVEDHKMCKSKIRLVKTELLTLMNLSKQGSADVFLKKENGKIYKYKLWDEMTTHIGLYDNEYYSQPVMSYNDMIWNNNVLEEY